jgi:hypothetical protein
MVNNEKIKESFAGLVGFSDPSDPGYNNLSEILKTSESGWLIDEIHPLVIAENLYNIAPNFKNFPYNFEPFDELKEYKKGNHISYNGNLTAKTDIEPGPFNPEQWETFSPFSDWLQKLTENCAVNFVNELLRYKRLIQASRSFVDSLNLYSGFGNMNNKIIKDGRFLGVEIYPNRQEGLLVRIDEIGFQVDSVQPGPIDFYLYHSSQLEPVQIVTIQIEKPGSFDWHKVNITLDSTSEFDTQGQFYLGYYENDITGHVIFRDMDFMKPCSSCSGFDKNSFNQWSKYVKLKSVLVEETDYEETRTLPDFWKENRPKHNCGMNLKISVYCDLTSIIIRNKNVLAEAFAQKLALQLIEKIAFNTRLGAISDKIKQLALSELNADPDSSSFLAKYQKTLQALNLDFSGNGSVCLPIADDSRKIRRGAI